MGFFQDLKQDLSQTVNDLAIKDEADELDIEERTESGTDTSTMTASEDLFGSTSDTDFEDLDSILEKEIAALGNLDDEEETAGEDTAETEVSDIDLEALLSDIEIAEADQTISKTDEASDFATGDGQPDSILDGFSFDDIEPIEEEISEIQEAPIEELPEEDELPIEELPELDELPIEALPEENLMPMEEELPELDEPPIEELSEENLMPIGEELPELDELPIEELSEESLMPIEEEASEPDELPVEALSEEDLMPIEEVSEPDELPVEEFSEEDLMPIEEEASEPDELPIEALSEEELIPIEEETSELDELPLEEVSETEETPEESVLYELPAEESENIEEASELEELPLEEILILEEAPEEIQDLDDNSMNAEENKNSEVDEDMEQLLNEVEQNVQEHTYMDEAPVTANVDNGETSAAISTDTAIITAGMSITGDVTSSGNMDLIGNITGNIEILGKLNVTGTITGNSAAAEVYAESAQINGEINSKGSVKIGQSSVVIGNIFAKSAVIAGAVKGDIDVHGPVILDTSAIVMGNIKSKSVQINNGAVIEGMCSQCYADVSPTSFFDEIKKNRK